MSPTDHQDTAQVEDKKDYPTIDHLEDSHVYPADAASLLKSRFDQLSIPRTIWVFRRAALFCFISFTWQMLDGWEVSRHVSIAADSPRSTCLGPSSQTLVSSASLVQRAGMGTCEISTPPGVSLRDLCVSFIHAAIVSAWSAVVVSDHLFSEGKDSELRAECRSDSQPHIRLIVRDSIHHGVQRR